MSLGKRVELRGGWKTSVQYGHGFGHSDHAQFDQAGIPVVFFLADDFSRIHTSEDTLEFIEPKLMGASAVLAMHILESAAGR